MFIFSVWLLDSCFASSEQGENLKGSAALLHTTGSRVHSSLQGHHLYSSPHPLGLKIDLHFESWVKATETKQAILIFRKPLESSTERGYTGLGNRQRTVPKPSHNSAPGGGHCLHLLSHVWQS